MRRRLDERRALERQQKRFGMRLEGSVAVERPPKVGRQAGGREGGMGGCCASSSARHGGAIPAAACTALRCLTRTPFAPPPPPLSTPTHSILHPQGTVLPGPLQQEASVRVRGSCGSLLGGEAVGVEGDYSAPPDAGEALPYLLGGLAASAAQAHASALRLQSLGGGGGALDWMDETELQAWGARAATHAAVAALAAARPALRAFQEGSSSSSSSSGEGMPFAARTEWGVLPVDHPQRTPARMGVVVAAVEGGDLTRAREALDELAEGEDERLYAGEGGLGGG